MSTLESLEAQLGEARKALYAAANQKDAEIREATSQIAERHRIGILGLMAVVRDCEISLRDEQDRIARESPKSPWPVGTRVLEWYTLRSGFSSHIIIRLGAIEVWTSDSMCPATHSMSPEIGSVVIRLMKKDGSPSKQFISLSTNYETKLPYLPPGWALEGERPK